MIQFKKQTIFYIAIYFCVQINLAKGQWNGGFVNYGSQVPHFQDNGSGNFYFTPIKEPVNTNPVGGPVYPVQGPDFGIPPPIYFDDPLASYQGIEQANALRAQYPNQPIIIINNGGNDDSNDGNRKGLDIGELAAIFLASKHHHGGFGEGPLSPPPLPQVLNTPAPQLIPQDNYSNNRETTSKSPTVNITIIVQGSASVEEKKKKKNKKVIEIEIEESDEEE